MPQRYALAVNKNWRITFGWHEDAAIDVDLEDYHRGVHSRDREPVMRKRVPSPPHPSLTRRTRVACCAGFVLPDLDRPMTEIARSLGISRQLLYSIVNEKAPVTPEVAVRLGKLCGNGPRLWVNMQAAYDLWHAERKVDVSKIPTLTSRDAA